MRELSAAPTTLAYATIRADIDLSKREVAMAANMNAKPADVEKLRINEKK